MWKLQKNYKNFVGFMDSKLRKGPLSPLNTDLHDAVEQADISVVMKCLKEGAEVILNINAIVGSRLFPRPGYFPPDIFSPGIFPYDIFSPPPLPPLMHTITN